MAEVTSFIGIAFGFVNFSPLKILYQATSMSSMVMSVDHPGLTFNLTLVRSEPTYNQPVQQWTFTSDFAVSMSI